MNILITGASGYIGRHLISSLSKRNSYLFGVVRKSISNRVNEVTYLEYDITGKEWPKHLPSDIDCVVHLAQSRKYRDFPEGAADMFSVNVHATFNLLEWARQSGVRHFVYASTGNVYKPSEQILDEEYPCEPNSMYGATKLSAETMVRQYSTFFQTTVLRIFGVYGVGQKNMLIPNLVSSINHRKTLTLAGGIGLKFTPIHIKDTVKMLELVIEQGGLYACDRFNICGNEILTLDKVIEDIAYYLGVDPVVEITDGEPASLAGSNRKFRQMFGFSPQKDFSTELKEIAMELKRNIT